jgi:hypothetical protein
MARASTTPLAYGPALLLWAAAAFKLPAVRRHPADLGLRAYWLALVSLAAALTVLLAPVAVALDRLLSIPNLARIETELRAEIATRQRRTVDEHDRHTARLAALDTERHKLLDAYYANAISLDLLKAEQDRISCEGHRAQQQLDDLNADLDDWHHTLTLAVKFAANCHTAYRAASETAKKQLNHGIFARIALRDGHVDQWEFHAPFDALFNPTRFEYGSKVGLTSHNANRVALIEAPIVMLAS